MRRVSTKPNSSQYRHSRFSFDGLKTIPIADRGGKVQPQDFGKIAAKGSSASAFLGSLPKILAGESFRAVVDRVWQAREKKKAILWGIGGHVIKVGLANILADLTDQGFATGFLMNGAATIHDLEIGIAGATSEDVEAVLPDGRFGSAEETGREINLAINQGVADGLGMGESIGRHLGALVQPQFANSCLQHRLYQKRIPVTVHVAVGTDTPHTYPQADGAAIGLATHRDFQLACSLITELDQGGVYLNVGSAVLLPEVFLKCLSVVRNHGHSVREFTTVNFDFLQHYRPTANVVHRPHAQSGGKGYAITGHHELMIPLLAACLMDR
jgi:hypothetical protein